MSLALPIIDRPIDNTAMTLFMKCPRKYDFAMRRHRRHSGVTAPALAYGTAWHKMMEIHYRTGGLDQDLVFMALHKSWEDHGKADDHRTVDRCWMEYENYVKHYGLPADEEAQTVGFPETPLVEISANVIWPGGAHAYAGKLDRIILHQGQYYVEDHKTTTRMGDYYFKQFELSNQMMGYVWIARKLYPSIKVAGVRINGHCVLTKSSKFRRQTISFSDDRLEEWAENYNNWIGKITQAYVNNDFPGNYSECDGKYRQCEYAEVCSLPPRFRDQSLEDDYDYLPWNPLESEEPDEVGDSI